MLIALHEAATKRAPSKIQPLQNPSVRTIKTPMRLLISRITALNVRLIAHLETKRSVSTCCESTSALNSGLLSMLMRLGYISVGLWPNRQLDVRQHSTRELPVGR